MIILVVGPERFTSELRRNLRGVTDDLGKPVTVLGALEHDRLRGTAEPVTLIYEEHYTPTQRDFEGIKAARFFAKRWELINGNSARHDSDSSDRRGNTRPVVEPIGDGCEAHLGGDLLHFRTSSSGDHDPGSSIKPPKK